MRLKVVCTWAMRVGCVGGSVLQCIVLDWIVHGVVLVGVVVVQLLCCAHESCLECTRSSFGGSRSSSVIVLCTRIFLY